MFEGAHTAIVTPFLDGKIDEPALRNLIDFQFDNKFQALFLVAQLVNLQPYQTKNTNELSK